MRYESKIIDIKQLDTTTKTIGYAELTESSDPEMGFEIYFNYDTGRPHYDFSKYVDPKIEKILINAIKNPQILNIVTKDNIIILAY